MSSMSGRVVSLFVVWLVAAAAIKLEDIDHEHALANEKIYMSYIDCLFGKAECTPEGKVIKDMLPKAMPTYFEGASEELKEKAKTVLAYVKETQPEHYDKLEKMYDPAGNYRKKYFPN